MPCKVVWFWIDMQHPTAKMPTDNSHRLWLHASSSLHTAFKSENMKHNVRLYNTSLFTVSNPYETRSSTVKHTRDTRIRMGGAHKKRKSIHLIFPNSDLDNHKKKPELDTGYR